MDESTEQEKIHEFAKSLNSASEAEGTSLFSGTRTLGLEVADAFKSVVSGINTWEYKFLAATSLLPSVLCRILPIVAIIGEAGSGKTQILTALSKISGQQLISGQSTGASLKNHINRIRWADPETKTVEKNCLLLVDNLNDDSFKKPEYLSSFLNGYNRETDTTYISDGKGKNIEFKTFCCKAYTSVWEIESLEIQRRAVVIRTAKLLNAIDLLDIHDINWYEFRVEAKLFWETSESWESQIAHRRELLRLTRKPSNHSRENWILLIDVLATALTVGCWSNVDECLSETSEWLTISSKQRPSFLEKVIITALESILGIEQANWSQLSQSTLLQVQPRHLKEALDDYVSQGLIDRPKLTDIQLILKKLSFYPKKEGRSIVYVYFKKNK